MMVNMTKTKNKEKKIKKLELKSLFPNWEKEFEKNLDCWVVFLEDTDIVQVKTSEMEQFITNLLSSQRQEIIKEIEGMKKETLVKLTFFDEDNYPVFSSEKFIETDKLKNKKV